MHQATAWPSQDEVLWAAAVIYSRAFQLSRRFEHMPSFDEPEEETIVVETKDEEERFGEQSMMARGLWWSVEENLDEDPWDSSYDEDDDDGAWGDFDSEDEDEIWRDESLRVFTTASGGGEFGDSSSVDDSMDFYQTNPEEFFEEDGVFLALVPWADAFNHDVHAKPDAMLTYNASKGIAEMRATASVPVGSEVCVTYEPGISRQDLFVNYGFVAAAKRPPTEGPEITPDIAADAAAAAAAWGVNDAPEMHVNEDEESIYGQGDVVDLPGDEFWEEAERVLCGAAGPDGDRDRQSYSALRAYLTATGMGPGQTTITITSDGADKKAVEWCQLAVISRQELINAGWKPPEPGQTEQLSPNSIEAWIVVGKLMTPKEEEAKAGVGLENDVSISLAREERARRVLRALCERRLAMYSSEEDLTELADGVTEKRDDDETEPAFGAQAAIRLIRSEKRALKGTMDKFETYMDITPSLACDLPQSSTST